MRTFTKTAFTMFLSMAFLVACGGDEEETTGDDVLDNDDDVSEDENGASDDFADVDKNNGNESENDDSNNNEEETDENNEEYSQMTEDEAEAHVIDYINENKPEIADFLDVYQFSVEENDDIYQVNMFSAESDDERIGSPLMSSYEVDRTTGEVEEVENQTNETESQLSEIVDLNQEERRAHHEELAVKPEEISDEVYVDLLLSGIHENTEDYNGRVNSGDTIMFEFPDAENSADRSTEEAEVSEDGYFTIHVNSHEFKAGQDIRVYITNGYSHEQVFELPVHEAEEGMEEIRVK
ncbi:hypothetical protein HUG15_19370 [Salicibibacter cibarius]|uniref:Uncharacterized protein n=1 Tax=Salicibibacter cibarius TaxID=2743000 RepID=A0A7T6Z650_9BACI|nr:hypothetical protein [Salicibibacter cibarius]QQK77527.1 hypothetical protein HUG15_19370 [Salicibibacter cibarius]